MDAGLFGEVTLRRLPLRFPLCTMHFEILNYEFMPEFEVRQETEMTVRQKSHYLIRPCLTGSLHVPGGGWILKKIRTHVSVLCKDREHVQRLRHACIRANHREHPYPL